MLLFTPANVVVNLRASFSVKSTFWIADNPGANKSKAPPIAANAAAPGIINNAPKPAAANSKPNINNNAPCTPTSSSVVSLVA